MIEVSVVMSVYNNETTIAACLQSLFKQTYTNWELIICDDCSTDNTYDQILELTKCFPFVIVLRNDINRGISYSLNRCIAKATGRFCARMDGDDLCDPKRFEIQVRFLLEHPEFGFVSSTMKRFDEYGYYDVPQEGSGYSPSKLHFLKGSPFCHAPAMIRRDAYARVNGYRDIRQTKGVEDYDLWFRLYANGVRGYIIEQPLYSMFDGRDAAKRRTFRRRLNEAWVRWKGYCALRIPFYYFFYVFKPILVGLIPINLYKKIRRI